MYNLKRHRGNSEKVQQKMVDDLFVLFCNFFSNVWIYIHTLLCGYISSSRTTSEMYAPINFIYFSYQII
jgi:hypothetical protein